MTKSSVSRRQSNPKKPYPEFPGVPAFHPPIRAMVLLGINCGFGNADVATLPQPAENFSGGWIKFLRSKTEIKRRVPLWPEPSEALPIAIAKRPKPAGNTDADLCFLTKNGRPDGLDVLFLCC